MSRKNRERFAFLLFLVFVACALAGFRITVGSDAQPIASFALNGLLR